MKTISTIRALRRELAAARQKRRTIGFVPTMGYFHAGHVSLMKASMAANDITVVSLFVNPLQFAPGEDLAKYPRDISRDAAAAREAGVDYLFVPTEKEMYPAPLLTRVEVGKIGDILCGPSRPGHFRGVATVLMKLLNIVRPDRLYLGQKDAQQAEIVRRMVRDLDIPVAVRVCPTVREKDGLAMSSRNSYLTASERSRAAAICRALVEARRMAADGERRAPVIISQIKKLISDGTGASIEYVSCVGVEKFEPVRRIEGKTLIAVAVRLGTTRLIDNVIIHTS